MEQFVAIGGVALVLGKFASIMNKEKKTKLDHEILTELIECFFGIGNLTKGCQVSQFCL